jgi:hypothetical protein
MTEEQANEIHTLSVQFRNLVGLIVGDAQNRFRQAIAEYLAALAASAICQAHDYTTIQADNRHLRVILLPGMRNYLGRDVTADDLVTELEAVVLVPNYLPAVITHDLAELAG